jgi:hypothetical protein
MFLYSVLTYYRLVPEAFIADGFVSQEKLVQFAMSFMSKDAAAVRYGLVRPGSRTRAPSGRSNGR